MNFKAYKKRALKIPEIKEAYDNYQVGNLITKTRIEKGIPQKELAEQLGMAASTISKIENDRRDCKIRELRKIAHALGKELKITFEDPEDKEDNDMISD
jgi:transcriptional regulator with XRE-family HTH domain